MQKCECDRLGKLMVDKEQLKRRFILSSGDSPYNTEEQNAKLAEYRRIKEEQKKQNREFMQRHYDEIFKDKDFRVIMHEG